LNLRFLPGLSFGERQLYYNIPVWETDYYQPLQYYSIKSTFLDFPLLIKYKARRINNDRPYIILVRPTGRISAAQGKKIWYD
jgi:hypothetical protein